MKKNNRKEKEKWEKRETGSSYSLMLKNKEGRNLHMSWIQIKKKNPLRKLRFQRLLANWMLFIEKNVRAKPGDISRKSAIRVMG